MPLAQADVLLTDAAEREWAEFWAPDPATEAQIQRRKQLWETVRRQRQTPS